MADISEEILSSRNVYIQKMEGDNTNHYKDIFTNCRDCGISFHVGRTNNSIKYYFPDIERLQNLGDDDIFPCHKCACICPCNTSDKNKEFICKMCDISLCQMHYMHNYRTCKSCYETWIMCRRLHTILKNPPNELAKQLQKLLMQYNALTL